MTPLLLDLTVDPALDLAIQEAVPEQLQWESLYSHGLCSWFEAQQMISLVGHDPSFTFLILNCEAAPGESRRFGQMTGGADDRGLLFELGVGNEVAIVAPAGAGWGRLVQITDRDPWVVSFADSCVLLPREEVLDLVYNWVVSGALSANYRLRPIEDYGIPTVAVR